MKKKKIGKIIVPEEKKEVQDEPEEAEEEEKEEGEEEEIEEVETKEEPETEEEEVEEEVKEEPKAKPKKKTKEEKVKAGTVQEYIKETGLAVVDENNELIPVETLFEQKTLELLFTIKERLERLEKLLKKK